MNVVREISRINHAELDIAINNPSASWHEQYKDSAYIFIGGLPYDLTEGDVITIFSQYGEVVDVNLPRANPHGDSSDRDARARQSASSSSSSQPAPPAKPVGKGKHRGFGFLMYEDQRSTVLAVDNLNGAQVLGRTLRVDHVASYKQPKITDDDGNRVEAEVKSFNAAPQLIGPDDDEPAKQEDDLEDPMAAYFQRRRREHKGKDRQSDDDGDDEQEKIQKRRRKEERARIRAEREQRRKHSTSAGASSRRNASPEPSRSKQDHDEERRSKRHRSPRDNEEDGEQVNRYQQMKKSRSILDAASPDPSERQSSSRRHSPTPVSTRSERSRHDDRDARHHRSSHSSSHRHHASSSSSRRRSRSRSRSPRQ